MITLLKCLSFVLLIFIIVAVYNVAVWINKSIDDYEKSKSYRNNSSDKF